MKRRFPQSFYNPITFAGAAIAAVSFGLVLMLIAVEVLTKHQKPYMGIITFIILPAFLISGLLLIAVGAIRQHRIGVSGGPPEIRLPSIDLNDPRYRAAFIVFSIGTLLLLMLTAFGSFKAYEYTDSDQFCGTICHTVMGPEYTAYTYSPHTRVGCIKCHIGPGADWFVRSKISGSYQMYAVLLNKYPRPIPTPIENLRPAQETCEQCHWPKQFFSEKLSVNTYYLSDDHNTRWTLNLLMKIGGGNIEAGPTSGIHWHMNIANEVTYAEVDPKRQVIPWIRSKKPDGSVRIYRSSDVKLSDAEIEKAPKRRMDCIDCHNRPSHIYHPPSQSINHIMYLGSIDPSLPYIKAVGVKALETAYDTKDEGLKGIARQIGEFYEKNYPEMAKSKKEQIDRAVRELQTIYSRNYFPEMKVSWRISPNNIGHLYSPGCFRCHDGKHVSDDGKVLSKDCNVCHTILAQQIDKDRVEASMKGVEYRHPVDIGNAWMEKDCSKCHGGKDTLVYFPHAASTTSSTCLVCHDAMKGRVKTAEGVMIDVHIDAGRYGKAVHGKLECTACHRNFSGGGHGPAKAADVPAEIASLAGKIKGKAKLEPVAYAACIECHKGAYTQWLQSVHAKNVIDKGSKDGAICTDCHGAAHYIQPKGVRESKVHWSEVVETCGRCHEDPEILKRYGYSEEILKRYKGSFHGKKHKLGQKEVPTCASCHGYHGVWKWTDPQSPMSVDKRKETCGRCHPGATDKFVGSVTHKPAGAVAHYTEKGLIVLVLGTFLFIFSHVILNVYADIRDRIFRKGGGHE